MTFRDLVRDTFNTLRAHKLRTALTMFGIAWGIVSITLMVAAGEGLRVGQQKVSQNFGKDIMIVFAGRTSMQAGGMRAGRKVKWTAKDPEIILGQAPACGYAVAELGQRVPVRSAHNSGTLLVTGSGPDFAHIRSIPVAEGRYPNWDDEAEGRRVAFLGSDAKKQLFGTRDAMGATIHVRGYPYTVVGLMEHKEQDSSYDGRDISKVFIPFASIIRDMPNKPPWPPDHVDRLIVAPRSIEEHEDCERQLRATLGRLHGFDPRDEEAAHIWDTVKEAKAFATMTDGMKYFLGAVGIATLFIGGIGVMNVMLVAVRERTREIGVRKALGATRRSIVRMFFLETMIVVFLSGGIGLAIGYGFCALVNLLPMPMYFAGLIPTWSSGLLAFALLGTVALLSALYPARRAASVDPIEALRFEAEGRAVLSDLIAQSWGNLTRNRTRSILTMLGIVWGITAVAVLMSYGGGFRYALVRAFDAFGKSAVVIWPGQTSEQAGGERAGRRIRLDKTDREAVLAEATLVKHLSMETVRWLNISYKERISNTAIRGVYPEYGEIRNEIPDEGRWISPEDFFERRRVVFLGSRLRKKLFAGRPSVGETVRIDGVRFTVIGGMAAKLQMSNYFTADDDCAFIPYTAAGDMWDTRYASVFVFSAVSPSMEEKAIAQVRQAIGKKQRFSATDERALQMFGREEFRPIIDGITIGLQVLLVFIGSLTLGIGGVGVANIMLVSVDERIREIGLRRAVGARKWHIRVQFLVEALVLTLIGGALGILVAWILIVSVGTMPLLGPIWDDDSGIGDLHLKMSTMTVLVSTAILIVVGALAGMVPALKASRLDPVDALRYE